MKELIIKLVRENAVIPTRATPQSAGLDLYACIDEPIVIHAGEMLTVPTGIAIALEDARSVGLVFARSGLGIKHGISLSNSVGVIDADYRGEIMVGLVNRSNLDYEINPSDRIAQLVIMPVFLPEIIESDNLPETSRNQGGFGSTGR